MSGEYKRYRQAEKRVEESIALRRSGLTDHDYPRRESDLQVMRHYHREYGVPRPGLLDRVKAWLGVS